MTMAKHLSHTANPQNFPTQMQVFHIFLNMLRKKGIDGVVMENEKKIGLLLAYNNSPTLRTPLSLSHSRDMGKSWEFIADVENTPNMQFAYPTVIQSKLVRK